MKNTKHNNGKAKRKCKRLRRKSKNILGMKRSKFKKCINIRKICLHAMSISKTAAMGTICLAAGSRFRILGIEWTKKDEQYDKDFYHSIPIMCA